jgi:spermidine synthase
MSAFLLFQVQPIIAKTILPWFGGSSAVWSTCMLFFQAALLAGYLYAHGVIKKLDGRRQAIVHIGLMALSLFLLPIIPDLAWKPAGGENPTWRILGLLATTIGLPYFLLSTTSPLLQAWYSRANSGAIPYRLFALSNFASFLALVSYPPLVEPNLANRSQAIAWSAGYGAFVLVCAAAAWFSRENDHALAATVEADDEPAPGIQSLLLWMGLAACPSILLLTVTTHLTQDVASIPFLWIIPLVIYLLTFILCFESKRFYWRVIYLILVIPALGGMAYMLWPDAREFTMKQSVGIFLGAFFVVAMVCHGELVRLKPHPKHLTLFYVMLSVGGAIGGLFVGLVAPNLFNAYYEFQIGLGVTACLVVTVLMPKDEKKQRIWGTAMLVVLGGYLAFLGVVQRDLMRGYVTVARNFYGQLRIEEEDDVRKLMHGVINHGTQVTTQEGRRKQTTYYCPSSGVGEAILARDEGVPQRIGVIGLGTGTLASYGRLGDSVRIYEINPIVLKLANSQFTYLKDTPAKVDVAMGDARLSLEREPSQGFDVLAVDAFSGDSIPVHLLTRESFQLFFKHLRPHGILAVHISNRYLDLQPVVAAAASELGKVSLLYERDETDEEPNCFGSTWVLVADKSLRDTRPRLFEQGFEIFPTAGFRNWTDDYSNLYKILK